MLPATPALIRSKVTDIVGLDQRATVVAIAASPVWPHDERLPLTGDRVAVVRPCASVLAAHDALSRVAELADAEVLVLLTDRDSGELGDGITARPTGQRAVGVPGTKADLKGWPLILSSKIQVRSAVQAANSLRSAATDRPSAVVGRCGGNWSPKHLALTERPASASVICDR